jgi:hypothetical protein
LLLASVVRNQNTTWSPAVMLLGVAVSCAVGVGPESGGGPPAMGDVFFLQPAKPITATSKTRQVRMRFLELNLFSPFMKLS